MGQVPYGLEEYPRSEKEKVTQKWTGVLSEDREYMITLINRGTHGFDFIKGELRSSLLRSPAYAAHPVNSKPLVPQDRFEDRIDQGERTFRFWFDAGTAKERLSSISRESTVKNESPPALCFFPSGKGRLPEHSVLIEDETIQMKALKKAEEGNRIVLRLFEPIGTGKKVRVSVPVIKKSIEIIFKPFEIKTLSIDLDSHEISFTDLLEKKK